MSINQAVTAASLPADEGAEIDTTPRRAAVAALCVLVSAVVPAEARPKGTKIEVTSFRAVPDDGKTVTRFLIALTAWLPVLSARKPGLDESTRLRSR